MYQHKAIIRRTDTNILTFLSCSVLDECEETSPWTSHSCPSWDQKVWHTRWLWSGKKCGYSLRLAVKHIWVQTCHKGFPLGHWNICPVSKHGDWICSGNSLQIQNERFSWPCSIELLELHFNAYDNHNLTSNFSNTVVEWK